MENKNNTESIETIKEEPSKEVKSEEISTEKLAEDILASVNTFKETQKNFYTKDEVEELLTKKFVENKKEMVDLITKTLILKNPASAIQSMENKVEQKTPEQTEKETFDSLLQQCIFGKI